MLGRSGRAYVYGTKPAEVPGRWDAVLTIADAETGAVVGSPTVREAERGKWRGWATDWHVYGGALSTDERRIALSYHGHDTTGADLFTVSAGSDVSHRSPAENRCVGRRRARRLCGRRRTTIELAHGAVAAADNGFVAAAAEQGLIQLDQRGRVIRRMRVATKTHLMDFAFDSGRSLLFVSACGKRPAIHRLDLSRNRQETLPSGRFCGNPLPSTATASWSCPPAT
jgi:hypothetical protein